MPCLAHFHVLGFSATAAVSLLGDAIAKGVILLALVALALACWRHSSAATRHMVWFLAIVGLVTLPIMSWALPSWNVLPRWLDVAAAIGSPAEYGEAEDTAGDDPWARYSAPPHAGKSEVAIHSSGGSEDVLPEGSMPASVPAEIESSASPGQGVATIPTAAVRAAAQQAPEGRKPTIRDHAAPQEIAAAWLLGLWAAGASTLLLRLLASHFGLRRLARNSRRVTEGALWATAQRFASALSVRRSIQLHLSRDRRIPMTWGLLHPHILLPADAVQWDEARSEAVLMHELAHVRRWDCQTQWLAQLACALYWLNPLVWLAAWRIDVERERACDDQTLSVGMAARDYAEHLVGIASGLSRRELASYAALPMARPSRLERRLSMVLNDELNRRGVTAGRLLAAVFALAIIVLPLSIMHAAPATEEARSSGVPGADEATAKGDESKGAWSEPIDGLQFRLSATRTDFQPWELPTFVLEVRNSGEETVTAAKAESLFGVAYERPGLFLLFKDQHKLAPNPNLRLVPRIRFDAGKLIGLEVGQTIRQTLTLMKVGELTSPSLPPYELTPGRYTIGIGEIVSPLAADLKTNTVTLNILPPGVENRNELAALLKPCGVNGRRIEAGFVPNKTTLVWGEPMFVTFTVRNLDEEAFTFEFGGDYRGTGRHDRFKIEVTGPDGKLLPDPSSGRFGGGILTPRVVQGHDLVTETVELADFRSIPGPGEYTVSCRFDLMPSWVDEGKAEFNVPVEARYKLTILPREPAHVDPVLQELFSRSYRTSGAPLERLIHTISTFGKEAAVPGLAKMAAEGDTEHRIAAAGGLGKVTTPRSLAALLEANRDREIAVRAAALTALGAFTDPAALKAAVEALSDANGSVREAGAGALGAMNTEGAIDALIERLPESRPQDVVAILLAMGASRSPRVFGFVARSLASENDTIRRAAADAITKFPAEQAAEALRPYAADADMDFREGVIRKLAESLDQPIDPLWLVPVIKSRRGANSIGDAPRLLRLYAGHRAVPALLSCLDFEDPAVRHYYNSTILDSQLSCRGALAVPWHSDLNRDGTPQETEENRNTLRIIKAWVEDYYANPRGEVPLPWELDREEEARTWGEPVDGMSIRARIHRTVWPAGLPQVISVDARSHPGEGSVHFPRPPDLLEVEVNGDWHDLAPHAGPAVRGDWDAYHGNRFPDIQLDGRWLRKADGRPLELKPGKYVCRVRLSTLPEEARTGWATSKPVEFEVIPVP